MFIGRKKVSRRPFVVISQSVPKYWQGETNLVSRLVWVFRYWQSWFADNIKQTEKGKTPEEIADALEESVENIQRICRIAEQYAPEYPAEEVCHAMMS